MARDDQPPISADPPVDHRPGGFLAVFIERPILASVVSLLVMIAGLAALMGVEVRELPEVDQPVVTISANYEGATPEAIDAEVTSVLESAVATVDGVRSISSSSSFGRSRVTVEFADTVDIDRAATDVQNAVAGARDLPENVDPPQVVKADSDGSPVMRLMVSSATMPDEQIADLVEDVIIPRLQSVPGVAQADAYGAKVRVIRVRIMPAALAARGLGVDDVTRLVATAAQNDPSGRLRTPNQEILIRAEAPATTPEAIGAMRLDARTLLSDVAIVEWGFADERTTARVDGAPGAGIAILRQAQSNTVEVAKGVRAAVEELKQTLPAGVNIRVTVDDSVFIDRAIEEVVSSLLLATAIVIVIIFLFIRSFRATLIPAIVIPVSLLGTVAAIYLAGFSINLLTLLALVMATGLVVDDAIVVTENIERWRAKGAGKRAAAILGSREIVFAVLSTTATLAAVFIPISFLPGQAGRLFSEFGFVLAFAVLVSSFVALTLAPTLTVRFGREKVAPDAAFEHGRPKGFLARAYGAILEVLLRAPWAPIGASIAFALAAWGVYAGLTRELTPVEDRGRLFAIVTTPESANFSYLDDKVRAVEQALAPFVESGDATSVISINGVGGSKRAFVVMTLREWSERSISQQEIEAKVRPALSAIPGVSAFIGGGNSLGIRGGGQGLQFAVAADDYAAASDAAERLAGVLEQSPLFESARLNFQISQPQITIDIDRDAATMLGVPVNAITTTVRALADEFPAADVFVGDDIIEVLVSAGGQPIDDPTDLANVSVRTTSGAFVPLSSVATVRETPVASSLSREERRRAVPVTAALAGDARLGDAVAELRRAAAETLPGDMSIVLLGEARLLEESSNSTLMVFAFAGLIVFLVLAAQFESFVSALIIMSTVPFGLAAAAFAIQLTGGSLNYYSQIGLVLLIGIMAKNGILIVEFANQLRDRGESVRDAILDASIIRLRPVLMTALSTLLGGLPLILGSGAGAESRAALGWVIVGGLGFATIFTLFLTPVAFQLLAGLSKPRASEAAKLARELADAPAR